MVNPYEPPSSSLVATPKHSDELARRGIRLVAAVIDGIISSVISFGIIFAFGLYDKLISAELEPLQIALLTLGGFASFLLIHGYTLANSGQTLGKKVMNIQIVSAISGNILSLAQISGLRYLPMMLMSSIPVVGSLISLVNILFIFRSDRRCIHDHIAKTKVVQMPT